MTGGVIGKIMKRILIFAVLIVSALNLYAEDRPKIYSLINKEIFISNTFAGETIALVKEDDEHFINRQILRSGLQGGPESKYQVKFNSDFQIRFSKIMSSDINPKNTISEEFILSITDEGKVKLFLNGLEVVIVRIEHKSL